MPENSGSTSNSTPTADPGQGYTAPELPLVRTRQVGGIRVHAVEAGLQHLDGGAMFGVVPRTLWERRIQPDSRHRIPLALRCLLIEAPESLILVDTGVGRKEDDRFRDIYGIDNAGAPSRLEDGIRAAGFEPTDVETVILTHLHFDHAGGATLRRDDGSLAPSFPWAQYVVQEGELAFSGRRNERIRASYTPENIEPITEAGLWRIVSGEVEFTRGVHLIPTPGHTPHHQCIQVESDGEKAFFLADLCPTTAHIRLPWIMGYDLEPLVTLESKRQFWDRALREDWLLIFQHDAFTPWGRLAPDLRGLREEG